MITPEPLACWPYPALESRVLITVTTAGPSFSTTCTIAWSSASGPLTGAPLLPALGAVLPLLGAGPVSGLVLVPVSGLGPVPVSGLVLVPPSLGLPGLLTLTAVGVLRVSTVGGGAGVGMLGATVGEGGVASRTLLSWQPVRAPLIKIRARARNKNRRPPGIP